MSNNEKTLAELQALESAINTSLGLIEFNLDGTIITANDNFLNIMGYSLEELQGQHHSIFCEESYANSPEYIKFWEKMRGGNFDSGEYMRRGKSGNVVFIHGTYNPIIGKDGKIEKVIKIANDITHQKLMEKDRNRQSELIMEMSTPVMRLMDKVLLLPIVGMVDSNRVQLIMETALENISTHQARVLILDIQGVPAVDSAVANHLIQITRATKLMGCMSIVTGISAEISQALVNLGLDLGDIITQSTLKDGVESSLKALELKLVHRNKSEAYNL
jgi:methyl-accepting chemotaxis protein